MQIQLDHYLSINEKTLKAANLTDHFSEDDLARIGSACYAGYQQDEGSRIRWLERNEAGMDLALQIQKDKTFPWPQCANVAFPLVTIAAMQFHARAYPALVSGSDLVKQIIFNDSPAPEERASAERVGKHMSWQLLYQDKAWESQEDCAILNVAIVGCNFKKTYYSPKLGHNVSELVLARDLVVDYWTKSLETSPRKTHIIPMYRNDIRANVLSGTYRDVLDEAWYQSAAAPDRRHVDIEADNRQGKTPPISDMNTPYTVLEQHVNLDLDNDGYAEPYIITLEASSQSVLRIILAIDSENDIERVVSGPRKGEIIRIRAEQYFTKKSFIPSPDGGFYDIGFGVFLGPLNETVNSLINMMLDSGTLQTTAGGFLGRGAKIRGGAYTFAPFEWKRVDSVGDDLRKNIVPLQIPEPSAVLFNLLTLLINYTNRIAGTTDPMVGENPGQNTPAENFRGMVEMGQKIYAAIFKRLWRCSRDEYQKLYALNARFLPLDWIGPYGVTRDDYQGQLETISPVADPEITSDTLRVQLATAVREASATAAGYDHDAVERRWLKALKVDNIDEVYPGTNGAPPPEDPKVTLAKFVESQKTQRTAMELEHDRNKFIATSMEEQRLNNAKIVELLAKAQSEMANAESESTYAQVAAINAQISGIQARNDHLSKLIEHALRAREIEKAGATSGAD